ncbi:MULTISPECIES: general stress protein [unclassified Actinomyces]|uniref:general stress protein n=1 Tax=unclassified Actinomyces TaxID=2609248 RepID=UPI001F356C3B|nr:MULTISPECIES: general stress protein [unclassified Actinomyces]
MSQTEFSTQAAPFGMTRGSIPRGDEVASFATYAEAQHAVDSLSDAGFPVQHLAIIGTDLRQVERITGRMSWGRALANGAMSGLWIGLFFAAMMLLLGPSEGTSTVLIAAIIMGVIWGMIFQVAAYAVTRGKRDFTSISQVVASRYSIIASELSAEAARALADLPGNLARGGQSARRAEERRAARQQARGQGRSTFGSRPDEQPRFGVRLPEGVDPQTYSQGGSAAPAAAAPEAGQMPGATMPNGAAPRTPIAPRPEENQPQGTDNGPVPSVADGRAETPAGERGQGQADPEDDPYRRRPDDA